MSIPIIANNERSLSPSQSIHGSWCIINSLVGSQPDQMEHIKIIKGWWWRWSVNPRVDREYFSSIMSVDTSRFCSSACVSFTVSLSNNVGFVVIALHGHGAVGRWSDGGINICKHLLQSGGIHDVLSWRCAARIYPIEYGGSKKSISSVTIHDSYRNTSISCEHQYDSESDVGNFSTG